MSQANTIGRRIVLIYSGGMDSYTVLHRALQEGHEVHALSFDYGQKHRKELDYAGKVCRDLNIEHKIVDITAIHTLLQGSSLTSAEVSIPEGGYAEDNMKSTVVPNRNMILLSLAIGHAVSIKASQVWYGAHAGDHAIYPDCRPEFVERMKAVAAIADYEPIEIVTPYLHSSKIEILRDGLSMELDYSNSWTCYNGREKACGRCGACNERLEAFTQNNCIDPIPYE